MGSTEQERVWRHVLTSLTARFGVSEPVSLHKECVDGKLQWHCVVNVWYNASLRSLILTAANAGRRTAGWTKNLLRRLGERRR